MNSFDVLMQRAIDHAATVHKGEKASPQRIAILAPPGERAGIRKALIDAAKAKSDPKVNVLVDKYDGVYLNWLFVRVISKETNLKFLLDDYEFIQWSDMLTFT